MYIDRIRTVLEKYHAALLHFSDVTALRKADNCNINSLRTTLKDCHEDGLTGPGSQTWGDTSAIQPKSKSLPRLTLGLVTGLFVPPDPERKEVDEVFQEHLIVPHKDYKPDGLTQWVKQSFIPFFDHIYEHYLYPLLYCILFIWHYTAGLWHKCLRPAPQPRNDLEKRGDSSITGIVSPTTTHDSDATTSSITKNLSKYSGLCIERIASIITTVIACLLPVVAITILARVHSMGLILGLITVFTAVFSVGLVLLSSSSSRVEIFTATAAFSAVMVVFVQNQIDPNN